MVHFASLYQKIRNFCPQRFRPSRKGLLLFLGLLLLTGDLGLFIASMLLRVNFAFDANFCEQEAFRNLEQCLRSTLARVWPLQNLLLVLGGMLLGNALVILLGIRQRMNNGFGSPLGQENSSFKELEANSQNEQKLLSAIFKVSNAIFIILDKDGRIVRLNQACERLTGYTLAEVAHKPLWEYLIVAEEVEAVQVVFSRLRTGNFPNTYENHLLGRHGGRSLIAWSNTVLLNAKGEVEYVVATGIDITEQRLAEGQLQYHALYDPLTSLPNRALFLDRLGYALERTKRYPSYVLAVLFLDFDQFKIINDSLGHALGDKLLVAIAQKLEKFLCPVDTLARIGGDEFAILLEDIETLANASKVAEKIHAALAIPFMLEEHEVFTSVSIGIATSLKWYAQAEDLLRDADVAMHRAKSLGRARSTIFDSTMHTRVVTRWRLETELRRAVDRDQICVFYQPIISLKTGTITGFEALARWNHPQRGMISPIEFIPIAEETELINQIGAWVLNKACQQMCLWQKRFPVHAFLSINVNLSGRQLQDPLLVDLIGQVLQKTGLAAHLLQLEITESIIAENTEATTTTLNQLRALDVKVHIDDFGTGYSSLSYLHHFPVDALKIDRSFIRKMSSDEDSAEIVRLVVTMAHQLRKRVVAEGVETAEQLARLRTLNCDYAQGFLFSQPMAVEAVEILLVNQLQW